MKIRWGVAAALAAVALALGATLDAPAGAADLPPPAGPVLVTVAGAVENANRGPVDAFADGFFAYHEIAFERAAEFDLAALEALGMHETRAHYPNWPGESTFEGPFLADVLKAAGATGSMLRAVALDGYASEIPLADLETYPVLLALKRDGEYLGIGGRGPAWIVYPREDYPELQAAPDDAGLAWAVFVLLVE
jgi:hypothetical protein